LYVDDAVTSSSFPHDIDDQSEGNFAYDGNGNITTDLQKNITSMDYDIRNLQYKMSFGLLSKLTLSALEISDSVEYKAKDTIVTESTVSVLSGANVTLKAGGGIVLKPGFSADSGSVVNALIDASLQNQTIGDSVLYAYDSQGSRVKKSSNGSEKYYIRDMDGNVIAVYDENGEQQYVNLLGADVFGKYVPDDVEYYYYVKDHLGSTRAVVDGSGNPKEAYEYYPFGKIARSTTSAGINVDEKFTGKELDNDNNERIYYFGKRYYDGDLGKWPSPDPLAHKYPGWSPYNYALCRPMNLIDPNGMDVTDYEVDDDGYVTKKKDTDDSYDLLYVKGKDIEPLKLENKSILKGLSKKHPLFYKNYKQGHIAQTADKESVYKAFKFLAENTSVEWKVQGLTDNNITKYALITKNSDWNVGTQSRFNFYKSGYSLVSQIHSHPAGSIFGPSTTDMRSHTKSNVNFDFNVYDVTTRTRIKYNSVPNGTIKVNTYKDLYD
jgi:RHS repeat-associated protein